MRILLMYPTEWCCLWQLSFLLEGIKNPNIPLYFLYANFCHLKPNVTSIWAESQPGGINKSYLYVHASHCLFHTVINVVSGFGLILKRLWHSSEHFLVLFPGGYGSSTCQILSLCCTYHWPFSPSCTNCTKSPSSSVRESGKQLSKLPSTRKRLVP